MVLNSGSGWGIFNREILRDFLVVSSRPCGTFRLSNLYPGLHPGLRSVVPAGLNLQSMGSHADSSAPEVRLFLTSHRVPRESLPQCFVSEHDFSRAVKEPNGGLWRLRENYDDENGVP